MDLVTFIIIWRQKGRGVYAVILGTNTYQLNSFACFSSFAVTSLCLRSISFLVSFISSHLLQKKDIYKNEATTDIIKYYQLSNLFHGSGDFLTFIL